MSRSRLGCLLIHQNVNNAATAYSSLGYINECLRKKKLAFSYYTRGLHIYLRAEHVISLKHPLHIANRKLTNDGNSASYDYEQKFQECEKELLLIDPFDKPIPAGQYNRIGMIHTWKTRYQTAIKHFEIATQFGLETLPQTYPELAV
ncbi:unnamed protein product [Didymodactylos carnosus]|uniref:Uncharacterized protein n=1 Tax=Didymodactylos carnosus TaxID=1234261 RepID=A0A815XXT2_9BILA|nr:unnamed protein product [Didymodactylos carnosus]CAF1668842.1 unnamed protein product [Didymodactylos carnosus]CAF4425010.1 unnamed protein product [Didymodactylos carnosus]CAF4539187.1 unnamed protein product [Didymodactylos carnosus]